MRLERLGRDDLLPLLQERLADGGCALVVRNTVRRAQETYEQLREVFGEEVSLNHARFTIGDRQAKDTDLLRRFGPPRPRPRRPYRAIVVATQVVEQSLDIDFDLLVTDLAPVDLVIQRLGRLQRHERPRPVRLADPVCYVDWLPSRQSADPSLEPGAKAIYGEEDLLRSAATLDRVIMGSRTVTTPDDVHGLIEAVYGGEGVMPAAWEAALDTARRAAEEKSREKQQAAQGFLLETPPPAGTEISLVGWLHTAASDSEEKGRAFPPAQAGMIPALGLRAPEPQRFPRASGDDPLATSMSVRVRTFLPRKRG